MVKVITVLVVALAFVSGAAAQTLTQGQNWSIGLNNQVDMSGAAGSASSIQGLTTLTGQDLTSSLGATGTQSFSSALTQIGSIGEDEEQTADLLLQAAPFMQIMDGLGTGSLLDLGSLSTTGTISTPFSDTPAPLGISTGAIPWDTEKTGGLGKPWQ